MNRFGVGLPCPLRASATALCAYDKVRGNMYKICLCRLIFVAALAMRALGVRACGQDDIAFVGTVSAFSVQPGITPENGIQIFQIE